MICNLLSIVSVKYAGLAVGVGIGAASSMSVSFIWGALMSTVLHSTFPNQRRINNIYLAIFGLCILLVGVAGVAMAGSQLPIRLGYRMCKKCKPADEEAPESEHHTDSDHGDHYGPDTSDPTHPLTPNSRRRGSPDEHHDDPHPVVNEHAKEVVPLTPKGRSAEEKTATRNRLIGLFAAIALGIPNGSNLVPMALAPADAQGINYIISFGLGVGAVTPILFLFWFLVIQRKLPVFNFPAPVVNWALLAGLLWNFGNFSSIYATNYLGFSIGFPLTQLALVVAALWGILFYKEITNRFQIIAYIISCLIIVGGAFLLGFFG